MSGLGSGAITPYVNPLSPGNDAVSRIDQCKSAGASGGPIKTSRFRVLAYSDHVDVVARHIIVFLVAEWTLTHS